MASENDIGRRTMLKALTGVPVLGALGIQLFRKASFDEEHNLQREIVRELDLEDLMNAIKPVTHQQGDLLRLGIVGWGIRGPQVARALGFIEKTQFDTQLARQRAQGNPSLETQMTHGNLNVAITGVCDVYDSHAEKALAIAAHDIHSGGELSARHPARRFRHYHEMLADPSIDGIIIATPDHHHAQMTIDAIQAGKHVYCEKCLIHREEEIFSTYEAVTNSDRVFQQGHQYPQTAAFQVASEILRRELLGKISHVETTTNRNSPDGAWIRHLDGE